MSDAAPIFVKDLTCGYDEVEIVKDVSLTLSAGTITCVLGPSGSGKSTLIRSVVGLLPPMKGQVELFGQPIYEIDETDRASELSRVGVMFQGGALLGSLTLVQNLAIPLRAHTDLDDPFIERVAAMKLGLVGLGGSEHKLPGELSGGMRKRAAVVRALMLDPELVVCDEPGSGLDPVIGAEIDALLLRLKRLLHLTLVVITHDMESVRRLADRVVLLERGRLTFDGSLDEAQASDNQTLQGFFGGKTAQSAGDERRTLLQAMGGSTSA